MSRLSHEKICKLLVVMVAGFILSTLSVQVDAQDAIDDVCTTSSVPPFIDAGVEPNLLLVIDNSGSMLDLAYTDESSQCFDETYLTNLDADGNLEVYVGNFDRDTWYEWTPGPYSPWESGQEYSYPANGDPARVYTDGIIYQVDLVEGGAPCTSAGEFLVDDTGCDWVQLKTFDSWVNGSTYYPGDILFKNNQFYRYDPENDDDPGNNAETDCVANDSDASDGVNIYGDTGCYWTAIDSTFDENATYDDGDVITYNGMYFEAVGTVTGIAPGDEDPDTKWIYLDEGKFTETTVTDISTHCDVAVGDAEYVADTMCIRLDETVTPTKMTNFVAKGNFMNWLSASKFDIQKEILTGGKYDYRSQRLISESRGCSGLGFTKQIELASGNQLTLRVRGRTTAGFNLLWDQVDSVDDTTRIDVLGITAGGFDYSKCEAAVIKILDTGLNGTQNLVDQCLQAPPGVDNGDQRAALNHALQYCWQDNYNLGKIYEDTGSGAGSCQTVYLDNEPASISPWYNAYHCFGVYDPSLPHYERTGYVGRCWNPGTVVGGTDPVCEIKSAVSAADDGCDNQPCEYGDSTAYFKNENNYNYECLDIKTKAGTVYCKNDDDWNLLYEWSDGDYDWVADPLGIGSRACEPGDIWGGGTVIADWSAEIDGNPAGTPAPDSVTDAEAAAADIPTNLGDLDHDAQYLCIWQAMEDYCADLTTNEVIDPSDESGVTTEYGNLPGNLIDAGVMNQLGIDHPIAVMKSYIEKTSRPEGVIQEVAPDLRMGVMAFNYVGAQTECDPAYVTGNVERFCPNENIDGAKLIAEVEYGALVVDNNDPSYPDLDPNDSIEKENIRWHADDMATSINATRATSWTPLAEAVYTALGYFAQNDALCINDEDGDGQCDDLMVADVLASDPVQYWCQDNNILIITEGESTADINAAVPTFLDSPGTYFGADPDGGMMGDEVAADYLGDDDGDTIPPVGTECSNLIGSTYFDDMTWWGQNILPLYEDRQIGEFGAEEDKQPITTHIVTTSSLGTGTGECSPETLMNNAATNGGTSLYAGEDPEQLEGNLEAVIRSILNRASAGSAASVISSSRSGEGAVYQAIFWPEVPRADHEDPLTWVGDVHGLFIDDMGQLWDDYDGDGKLSNEYSGTLAAGECPAGDRRLYYYYDEPNKTTRVCFTDGSCSAWAGCDKYNPIDIKYFDSYLWSAEGYLESLGNVADNRSVSGGLWSWADDTSRRYIFTWNDLDNDGIAQSTEILPFVESGASVNWSALNRTAGYHHDVLDDFRVDSAAEMDELIAWIRGEDVVEPDDTSPDGFDDRNNNGIQDYLFRCRKYEEPVDPDVDATPPAACYNEDLSLTNGVVEWRLGDVVHSTPKLVSQPAEAFHTIYRDPSYSYFVQRWRYRRSMVYFGANDGMLHAVNGGFFGYDTDGSSKFWRNLDGILSEERCYYDAAGTSSGAYPITDATDPCNGKSVSDADGPPLGTEMWAYIPYNLQPHLIRLTKSDYGDYHEYYVDKEPRIFDMKIFPEEQACTDYTPDEAGYEGCIHPGGWGTVLVGAMRFGGHPITAMNKGWPTYDHPTDTIDGEPVQVPDNRQFISAYFILDITNPEGPPTLLGETTMTVDENGNPEFADMGFSLPMVTGAVMRDFEQVGDSKVEQDYWYLVMGNGPSTTEGENGGTEQGKIAVMPMSWLIDYDATDGVEDRSPFRIPPTLPQKTNEGTDADPYTEEDFNEGGVFLIDKGADPVDSNLEISGSFTSDLITVDFDIETQADPELGALYKSDAVYFGTTDGYQFIGDTGDTSWEGGGRLIRLVMRSTTNGVQQSSPPGDWYLAQLIDAQAPISAGASIGWDGANFWVYFGTGRFYSTKDKTDDTTNYFFGLKETLDDTCEMTWDEIAWLDDTGTPIFPDPDGNTSYGDGDRGLFRSDYVNTILGRDNPPYSAFTLSNNPLVFCDSEALDQECDLDSIGLPELGAAGSGLYSFNGLKDFIAGDLRSGGSTPCAFSDATGTEGWYRVLRDARERVVGQSTLLGGLVTYTSYVPYADVCKPEGDSYLYGVHYQTGTAWYENIFGLEGINYPYGGDEGTDTATVMDRRYIGEGLATTPSLHTGAESDADAKAFIQTSTGAIIEIEQENLPIKPPRSGRVFWSDDRNPEFKYGEESESN